MADTRDAAPQRSAEFASLWSWSVELFAHRGGRARLGPSDLAAPLGPLDWAVRSGRSIGAARWGRLIGAAMECGFLVDATFFVFSGAICDCSQRVSAAFCASI